MNNQLRVGVSRENITPKLGSLLFGYPAERRAERVMDTLSATAIAIKQGEGTVIFISLDLCLLNVDKTDEIRKAIQYETGINWKNVIIGSIHTHSGPITRTTSGWGPANQDYLEKELTPKIIRAAKNAVDNLKPAVMGIGHSESLMGINRREIDADGNVILGQNPDGPYDSTMTLVSFKTNEGRFIGSIAHFAAHPTAAARNVSFTRDWPSLLIDKVEELTDAPCLFFNGAIGDVGPRLSNGKTTGGEEYIIEAGTIAAKDIEKAFNDIKAFEVPKLSVKHGTIVLSYVKPPSRKFAEERIAFYENHPDEIEGVRASQYDQMQKVKAIYDSGKEFPKCIEFSQTVVSLGDLALVPAPFEAFCKIALNIKEKSPFRHTVLLGLTNGYFCYLPTEDQLKFGGYEVDSFRRAGVVSFVDNTDKHFINQNIELLNILHNQSERN